MPDFVDFYGNVAKNGTAILMARVLGWNAVALTQSDFGTVSSSSSGICDWPARYSVYLIDEDDPDTRTVVTGHDDNALTISDIIFNTLQTDDRWTVDSTGYNFRHEIDISSNHVFTVAGRKVLIQVTITPSDGQAIVFDYLATVL